MEDIAPPDETPGPRITGKLLVIVVIFLITGALVLTSEAFKGWNTKDSEYLDFESTLVEMDISPGSRFSAGRITATFSDGKELVFRLSEGKRLSEGETYQIKCSREYVYWTIDYLKEIRE